ncbi:hypothetical protein ES706_06226 [subsurface metagenome]
MKIMNPTSNKKKDKIYLRIADAFKEDSGRGILRIDPKIARKYNFGTGDVIEVYNENKNKRTAGLLFLGRQMDNGLKIIRLDSLLKRNLGASINDWVTIRKIEAKLAETITFAAIGKPVKIKDPKALAKLLDNRVVTKGDIISSYAMGQKFDFMLMKFTPQAEAVRIHDKTEILISEKAIEKLSPEKEFNQTNVKMESFFQDLNDLKRKKDSLDKIKKLMKVSTRVRLDMMRDVLNMDPHTFNYKIIDWAYKFEFIIDGDYLIVNKETVSDFIDALDKQFS